MKETTITIETTSLLVLRAGKLETMWCPTCQGNVPVLAIARSDLRTLGLPRHLHQSEAADGAALICLKSLLSAIADDRIS